MAWSTFISSALLTTDANFEAFHDDTDAGVPKDETPLFAAIRGDGDGRKSMLFLACKLGLAPTEIRHSRPYL